MLNKIMPATGWFFSRTGFFYALLLVLALLTVDLEAVGDRIKLRRLNDLRPDMSALVSFGKGEMSAEKVNWKVYEDYFSLVVKYMPAEHVTGMFLGICEYYRGDPHKTASAHILAAAEAYPFIFWSLYNAGVLAFERGDMAQAGVYLERARVLPLEQVENVIKGAVIYRQLMAASNFDIQITPRMRDVQENIFLLLTAASFYQKDHSKALGLALYALGKTGIDDKEPFYFFAGAASIELGKVNEAMSFFSQCMALDSRNPLVYRYVGQVLKVAGRTAAADDMFRRAAALGAVQDNKFPYADRLHLRFF